MKALQIFCDRKLRHTLLAIAVPIALQNLITYCTGMMDTVMLGQLGEIQLSGASVANQYTMIFMGLSFGIASGTNVLLSQYWGKRDTASMRSILAVMYWLTAALATLFFVGAYCFPEQIIRIFTPDIEVVAEGAKYLRVVCFSYWAMGLSNVMLMTLRAVGTVKISLVVYTVSLVVNTFLNWVLIFGKLGAPRLEMTGGALATVIARVAEVAIAGVYIFGLEQKIAMRLRGLFHFDRSFIKDFAVNVMPVVLNELLWSLGSSALMMVMGRMGRAFVTANSITNITTQFAQIFTFGLSNATAVIIGNTVGAGESDRALELSKGLMILSVFVGAFAGVVIFTIRPLVVACYNITPQTKEVVMSVMGVASVVAVFQCIAIISMMGILRGGGDVHFVLVSDILFMWIFAIPLGALVGLKFGWPPAIVYLVLKSDEALKIIASVHRIWSGKWVKNLTR
ncbi:MAG: MATE family efflux transporter [Angelakisella sp.]